jgi:hypothetical protein
VHRTLGWAVVVIAVAVAFATALLYRTRLPFGVVAAVLTVCGAAFGVGGALIEGESGPGQAIAATVTLAVLTPMHVHVVLGPLGRRRA